MKPERFELAGDTDIAGYLKSLREDQRLKALSRLGEVEEGSLDHDWPSWAHGGQTPPMAGSPAGEAAEALAEAAAVAAAGRDWRTWVMMAGRGFGKTRAGAQWVMDAVRDGARVRIALVAATIDEARRVMVEGESGLLNVAGPWVEEWHPSKRRLCFAGGGEATLFSGANPEGLRGPEHHLAWCDELAKWKKPGETWDMLQLGLRLGERPRALVTTTPRPGAVLTRIMGLPGTVTTGGPTRANPHLPDAFVEEVHALYSGTRLARQELEGELLPDVAGALWTVDLIERCRVEPGGLGGLRRLAIGVDPPAGEGTCGIVACGRDGEGTGHVLADHSVTGLSPEGWAGAVAAAARAWASLVPGLAPGVEVFAEANQGGRMVESVLRAADCGLRVRRVNAREGKCARADPVSALFEAGRVRVHGAWPELEAQLCGLIGGGGYDGPGASPDRADAMVWAMSALMLGPERAEPRIRSL